MHIDCIVSMYFCGVNKNKKMEDVFETIAEMTNPSGYKEPTIVHIDHSISVYFSNDEYTDEQIKVLDVYRESIVLSIITFQREYNHLSYGEYEEAEQSFYDAIERDMSIELDRTDLFECPFSEVRDIIDMVS